MRIRDTGVQEAVRSGLIQELGISVLVMVKSSFHSCLERR